MFRRKLWFEYRQTPLVLFLLVLPNTKKDWLKLNLDNGGLALGGKAYWYFPETNQSISSNKSYKVISISEKNLVDLEVFQELFLKFHPNS